MPNSPYYYLIQRYFPPEQWENADCISMKEDPSQDPSAVNEEGAIDCGQGVVARARSWGLFQILDACWNPDMPNNSPFTPEQWANRLDPNVNTWMASIIWSRSGWGAWTTCEACQVCDVGAGAIPHPEGPVSDEVPPDGDGEPIIIGGGLGLLALVGAVAIGGGVILFARQARRG